MFDSALERPFNDWTDAHFAQGFAWRHGSVSFLTLDEGGAYAIEIAVSEAIPISPEAVRVIQTSFEVPENGAIEIGSISDSILLTLPSGLYALRFECFPIQDQPGGKIRLVFTPADNPWIGQELDTEAAAPGGAIGPALRRLLAQGAAAKDLTALVQIMQWQLLAKLCYLLEDLGDLEAEVSDIAWALFRIDQAGRPIAVMSGLHESVLETEPEGREMRP